MPWLNTVYPSPPVYMKSLVTKRTESLGPIGISICYDFYQGPELSRILALKGARLLVNPTGRGAMPRAREHLEQGEVPALGPGGEHPTGGGPHDLGHVGLGASPVDHHDAIGQG